MPLSLLLELWVSRRVNVMLSARGIAQERVLGLAVAQGSKVVVERVLPGLF